MAKKAAKKSSSRSSAPKSTKKSSRRKSASTARTNMARKKTTKRAGGSSSAKTSTSGKRVAAMKKMARAGMKDMGRRVKSASETMLKKAGMSQSKARRMVKQVKDGAAKVAGNTGTIVDTATKAAAMAAGVVVGTVQAVLPDDASKSSNDSSRR